MNGRQRRSSRRKNSLSKFYLGNDQLRKFFLRLREKRRLASQFSFTTFPRGSGDRAFISKTCSSSQRDAEKVMAAHCLSILPRLRWSAAAAGWNGLCSIGTNLRSSFIALWAQSRWRNGPYSG